MTLGRELFRKEVSVAKEAHSFGSTSLAQPLGPWILGAAAIVPAVLLLAFLMFGEYSYRSRVVGQLVPDSGVSSVLAPSAGVIARIYATEGQSVEAGDALIRIDVSQTLADGQRATAASLDVLDTQATSIELRDAATSAQLSLEHDGLQRQLRQALRELHQTQQAIFTRQRQEALALATLKRFRDISETRVVSQLQVDQQEQAWLEWVNQRQHLERQVTALQRGIAQMQSTLQQIPAQRRALAAASMQALAQVQYQRVEQHANGEMLLMAPVAGVLSMQMVESGQSVQAGQPLVSLLPRGSQLQAQLWVPSRAIGFVRPGSIVLLRYAAYPYQKFGHGRGKVVRISRNAFNRTDVRGATSDDKLTEPTYRVIVELESQTMLAYGNSEVLRPGMTLEADILGERRKLHEWLLEPIYALSGNPS